MYGYSRGWFGRGRAWSAWPVRGRTPAGLRYLGPCRCGWGPHAFYQDASGKVFHARDLYRWNPTPDELKEELAGLKAEKDDLEKRITELERQLKEEPGESRK